MIKSIVNCSTTFLSKNSVNSAQTHYHKHIIAIVHNMKQTEYQHYFDRGLISKACGNYPGTTMFRNQTVTKTLKKTQVILFKQCQWSAIMEET